MAYHTSRESTGSGPTRQLADSGTIATGSGNTPDLQQRYFGCNRSTANDRIRHRIRPMPRPNGSTVVNPSRAAGFAAKPFMHQHLEERLVSDAFSCCEFPGLGYIVFGQSQRNLDAGDLFN